jgi:prepilin-type N-terminal cleavage/methylation domain-containing protein
MKHNDPPARRSSHGFTLIEMSISMAIISLVMIGMFNLFKQIIYSYNETSLMSTTAVQASLALDRMVIGMGTNAGLREAQSSTVTATSTSTNWSLAYNGGLSFAYSAGSKNILNQSGKTVSTNVVASALTYTTNGCQISVSVAQSSGGRTVTNTMKTFVQFRN